ncbi:WW domain binding protein 1-like isoform X1 [Dunckerocampus dactyliophorus]|uniref:WW domain binding protein 1-like isoform X1 n=1 Tax=Dunckerocampus dactyliophorus TaxID=161453 RepID=UPI002404CFA0|nr:WW domain binding protein 1-like isoform X1 [Dunckerocampus dactyliophorus]
MEVTCARRATAAARRAAARTTINCGVSGPAHICTLALLSYDGLGHVTSAGFWLLWTALILFSCCCAYRHRRAKLRAQQQRRQQEISLLAYRGAASYPSSMLDLSFLASLKLPSYEEVAAQPSTPPPPYSSVFMAPRYPQPPRTADPHLLMQHGRPQHRPLSDGPSSFSSDDSSSCSCDSCCPSSPCSSSLSVPVTYETDTSHASTPSERAALSLNIMVQEASASSQASPSPGLDATTPMLQQSLPTPILATTSPPPESPPATVCVTLELADIPTSMHLEDPDAKDTACPTPAVLPPDITIEPVAATSPFRPDPPTRASASWLFPPKQTLFSPCVDVFEAEEEAEPEDEDDVDADESQYRHRRLTGDSGIEVCRCQVEDDQGREEDAMPEKQSDLHDSADCPARGMATHSDSPEEVGEVVVVMETA